MEGIYIIDDTLINLSQVKAIYGSDDFVCFDMVTGSGSDYSFNGYDAKKVIKEITELQEEIWGVGAYNE